jgi:capsular polysaccharide transport system ATP-binding protein
MIELKNVGRRFLKRNGSHWVIRNINITIPKGVSVGLIGQNGAGKSTLLRLIAGMDAPDEGKIIRNCSVSWPIGLKGGFQGTLTGRQNVKFVARIHGMTDEVDAVIQYVQDFAEIGDAFDEPLSSYSAGMRSRLAFGLSLAFDFDVYLSDEATSVGDAIFRKKATEAFKARVGEASLIIVSHAEGILKELCQAGIYIANGQAIWFDDINEALSVYKQSSEK